MSSLLVDQYIQQFPLQTQEKLQELRSLILAIAPEAQEVISYKMPAYKIKSIMVYFAGYANHIGFYPTGQGMEAFKHKMGNYKHSKGAVQFPIDQPLPVDLITEIVEFRKGHCQ